MCELCKNIKKGDHYGLVFDTVEVTHGRTKVDEHELSAYIGRDEDGNYMLSSRYYVGEGSKQVASVGVHIKYCPFCGAKLQQNRRITYPWEM